jgi:hypothetical protein
MKPTSREPHTESQKIQILEYLLSGRSFTSLEAYNRFKCMKATNRVSELKDMGFHIESVTVDTPTNKRIALYYMPGVCNDKKVKTLNP